MVRPCTIIASMLIALTLGTGCQSYNEEVNPLIEADELVDVIESTQVRIIDSRPVEKYQEGHLPGAIQVWRSDIQDHTFSYAGVRASRQQLEKLLQHKGLNANDHIVIYDDKGNVDAARLWWLLKLYRHSSVSLLHGGLQAWKSIGQDISNDTRGGTTVKGNIQFTEVDSSLLVHKDVVLANIDNRNYKIIDVRSTDEYSGKTQKSGAYRPGRIPGSISLEYTQTLNENAKFLPLHELDQVLTSKGISAHDSIIVYCQSGVRSAHFTFVLKELLRYPYVANYDGSWIEWSYHTDLPIEIDSISLTMK